MTSLALSWCYLGLKMRGATVVSRAVTAERGSGTLIIARMAVI